MTGDTIRAEVFAKYLDPDPSNWTAALHDLMAAIAGGTAPTGTVIEAVPSVGGDGFPFAGLLDAAKAGDTGIRAYLNILLFDENLGFLEAAYVPVSTAAREDGTGVPHERLAEEIIVQQPGYAYIYFSNDNGQPLEVFFDDFTVEHSHSAIVQADDYYPFGLTFNSYKRENSVGNKFLYNGKEIQEETGWYDYGFRMYDAAVARFNTVDPLAENYSFQAPYAYAANNPVTFIDFLGLGPASTHTDSTGNVLAVYKDGDNGVYRHNDAKNEADVQKNYSADNTSAGGEKMGETEYWDEFRAHDSRTGKILEEVEEGAKILFGESWDQDLAKLNERAKGMDLLEIRDESKLHADFDVKNDSKLAPYGGGTGKMLNGKYATARSAGNYLAGYNAAGGRLGIASLTRTGYM